MKTAWRKLRETNKYANRCYLGAFAERKTKQFSFLCLIQYWVEAGDFFSYWSRDKVRPVILDLCHFLILLLIFHSVWAIVKWYIARQTHSKGSRRLMQRKRERFVFPCHNSANEKVITADKAMPTVLVNYLPTIDLNTVRFKPLAQLFLFNTSYNLLLKKSNTELGNAVLFLWRNAWDSLRRICRKVPFRFLLVSHLL